VVAAVGGVGCGSGDRVIDTTTNDLRKRRENVTGSAGLEGRSRDRLENGLAPLDAEGRHDGGSESALRRGGECLAHKGGAERGGHGEYGGGRMGLYGREGWRAEGCGDVGLVWVCSRAVNRAFADETTEDETAGRRMSSAMARRRIRSDF
jgi:hypothetical protein